MLWMRYLMCYDMDGTLLLIYTGFYFILEYKTLGQGGARGPEPWKVWSERSIHRKRSLCLLLRSTQVHATPNLVQITLHVIVDKWL